MSSSSSMTDCLSLDEPNVVSNEITLVTKQGTRKVVSRDVITKMSTYVSTVLEQDKEATEVFIETVDDDVFEFIYEFMKMYASDPKSFDHKALPKPVGHRHLEYIVPKKYAEYVSHTSVNGSDEDLVSKAGMEYRRKIIQSILASAYLGCDPFFELLLCKIATTLRYYSPEEKFKRWGLNAEMITQSSGSKSDAK